MAGYFPIASLIDRCNCVGRIDEPKAQCRHGTAEQRCSKRHKRTARSPKEQCYGYERRKLLWSGVLNDSDP